MENMEFSEISFAPEEIENSRKILLGIFKKVFFNNAFIL